MVKTVKIKEENKHIIFDSYDTYSEENMESAKQSLFDCDYEEDDITENMLYNECNEQNSLWFDDELSELRRVDEGNGIIAIADLGLWFGRRVGYKDIKDLASIMYSDCDYETVYVDSNGDIRKNESHHDGSNSILYRYWKDGLTEEQKENFRNKCYNGELKKTDITRYTKKCGLGIARTYGWKVRGA